MVYVAKFRGSAFAFLDKKFTRSGLGHDFAGHAPGLQLALQTRDGIADGGHLATESLLYVRKSECLLANLQKSQMWEL